jgi:two-component system, cell cycle sensor histidine kinase and response regulator CckA
MNTSSLEANHRILIVDDNPAIHEDFRKIFCTAGPDKSRVQNLKAAVFDDARAAETESQFELVSAFQGREALALANQAAAENRPFAMAFLDVRMPPGWDGIETAVRLWEVCPCLQIVICTAYSDYSWDEMRDRLAKPDSLVILKKPFDNVEVQQLAHAMTTKWLLTQQALLQRAELERMVEERTQELKKANESLMSSEERFSKAFHQSPFPIAIQSISEQRFVDVNQCLAEIAGFERQEMIGRTAAELFLWEKPDLADQWVESLISEKPVRDQEAKIRTKTGALHEVLVSVSPVVLADEPHMLLLAQDVAERILLERQLRQAQKMEAVGQLAAGVAHDFNNILTVIQGHVGLVQQTVQADNPISKSMDQISKASHRASTLIQRLLMFSRKQVMQFQHLDLNDTLGSTIKMLERLVGEQVQIYFHPQKSIPAVYADPSMMEQIAMNLAVNARDAMPNGGRVSVTTSLETVHRAPTPMDPERRDGDFVCLTFSDTGLGMDTRILGRIFEPFFTTKPVGKGTGLGLSIVFGIVRAHKGWLEVKSEQSKGTMFRVYFPTSRQAAEKRESVDDAKLVSGSETVLVAEDEDALREMVVQVLKLQGYTVLQAASGPHALDVWEQAGRSVDLLLTDMVMPGGMTGGELAERLLGESPRLKVIYTSGYSPGMAGRDVSLLEGRNFLPKPYSIGKLAQFVRECLDNKVKQN